MPHSIRRDFGKLLRHLQDGQALGMPPSQPMPAVVLGVHELRVRDASGQYRAFIVRKLATSFWCYTFSRRSRAKHRAQPSNWRSSG